MKTTISDLKSLCRLLLAPASYLRVQNSSKRLLDVAGPCAALALLSALYIPTFGLNLFGEYGLVHGVSGLLQLLTGFFITALAAIATFSGNDAYPMDVPLIGEGAILIHGDEDEEDLTRRRFLCLMFGYLALTSLVLYIVGILSMSIAPSLALAASAHPELKVLARIFFIIIYAPVLGHMMATTCLGLVFLSARIGSGHPDDQVASVVAEKDEPDASEFDVLIIGDR